MSMLTLGLGPPVPPLQFLMRAFHTSSPIGYVYWIVEDQPDSGAVDAPYPSDQLTDVLTAFAFEPVAVA